MFPPQYSTEVLDRKPSTTVSQSNDEGGLMTRKPSVVCLCSKDDRAAERVLESLADSISVRREETLSKFKRAIREAVPDLVLCAWSFPTGTWRDTIDAVGNVDENIPVIVISKGDEEYAWSWQQVFEGGGFDLLAPPFQSNTNHWVLQQAIESRVARHAARAAVGA